LFATIYVISRDLWTKDDLAVFLVLESDPLLLESELESVVVVEDELL
jgi:hypothetical protein